MGFGEAGRTAPALDNSGGGGFEWWVFCGIILALGCESCVETASGDLMLVAAVEFACITCGCGGVRVGLAASGSCDR